ncbi:hypothetical protein GOV03_04595 [Candidatus Woesearchaeota archaeon]|nr:hypothetical protein [Candidatus Woesearchaeota archaeon]
MAKVNDPYDAVKVETADYISKLILKNPRLAEVYQKDPERAESILEFYTHLAIGNILLSPSLDEMVREFFNKATRETLDLVQAITESAGKPKN